MAEGLVTVHAAQRALHLHLEWAIRRAVGSDLDLTWEPQPLDGTSRTTAVWRGDAGTGSVLASALREWNVPFEVTEVAPSGHGVQLMFTPELGLFIGHLDPAGSMTVDEHRIQLAFARYAGDAEGLAAEFGRLLGMPWDEALEPYRRAADGLAPVAYSA